jgi:outer membrane immunogenic protein
MRMNFGGGIGVLAAMAVSVGAAGAADLAVKAPVYTKAPPVFISDWAGFYLGVHGGYGWGDSTLTALNDGDRFGNKPKGGLVGAHGGYNWQFGSVVTGLELDIDGADIEGTHRFIEEKTSMLASARTRLGYIMSPGLLAYGTAGAAFGHTITNVEGSSPFDASRFGWVAGAGLEYKLWGNFVARAEYLHYDFDKTVADFTLTETIDVVRGGLSYKF